MYTDGLNEGRNAVGEQFGEARLRQSVGEAVARSRDAEGAKNLLLHRLEDFRGAAQLTDDQTFILIRHLT
jgi:serine phosphatase RsbU (regulator of sigma subunit)